MKGTKYHRTAKGGYYSNMPSPDYWRQRSKETLAETMANVKALDQYEETVYRNALQSFITEYKDLIKPYLVEVEGKMVIDQTALKLAMQNSPQFAMKLARIDTMIKAIHKQCGGSVEKNLEGLLSWTYKNNVGKIYSAVYKDSPPLALVNDKAVKAAIHTPWTADGREFSDRIWTNLDNMSENLRDIVSQTLLKGTDLDTATKMIDSVFNAGYSNARRLIRTETCACLTQSSIDTYKELNIDEVEIFGTNENCDECGDYEGKTFPITDISIGVDVPPFHPNCRCCVVPVVKL